ncbi:alpha/beta fold hydrolase [Aureibacillus halotolerans]|uniref:Proline iminopeptidase n=1 Tax=Aureibacillus halotolerans TaxID=1508390 RepID=A0A4R6U101_9BACI|nr:alpha/beta hydrolase [Aureibacillus halotolerans]TDQ38303.1 proline iminopeptidase [Aureibacillus halotolerans]
MFTTLNGCEIYYEIHGQEDGEPIFFIHGGPGMGDCRGDVASFSALGDEYRLVFMDMRGSGRSADVPPFTHEQWTADIDAMRAFLGYETIHMLGGSYGGFLTLEYVTRYPDRVRTVLLRDTAPSNDYNDLSIQKALDSNLPGINEEMLDRLFDGRVASNEEFKEMFRAILPLYTVNFDETIAEQRVNSIYYHYETHNYAFHVNKKDYNLVSQLPNIQQPMLITVGRHDWITPVVCSEEIASHVPNGTLFIFENSGHSPQAEENEKYIQVVRQFLQDAKQTIHS